MASPTTLQYLQAITTGQSKLIINLHKGRLFLAKTIEMSITITISSPQLEAKFIDWLTTQQEYFTENNFVFRHQLTKQEVALFTYLSKYPNQIISYDQIADAIWEKDSYDKFSLVAISKLISRLRKKMKVHQIPYSIITKKDQGFILVPENK